MGYDTLRELEVDRSLDEMERNMLKARLIMDEKGITKAALSESTGIEMSVLEPILYGIVKPDEGQASAIAKSLEYERDTEELFDFVRGLYDHRHG